MGRLLREQVGPVDSLGRARALPSSSKLGVLKRSSAWGLDGQLVEELTKESGGGQAEHGRRGRG